mmetsp:Transcript_8230/g.16400  ORF Transcript_8230/g.16400 Transcript_8230/m.16400 type:complete len:567 (-) Transcript_8230:271-1971(-)|eukprot:CAMPEP_0171490766 /NCGR_PEP_ID=MMETSP0958-20121227/3488_1 /TAXON_ID=87120 /ORGANISM="Aurantiochytrium limacinum, Strain ATCCMYA-1381" /LENGTH=566 /DNA_ID=CAMNT_0012024113 /DNA_START=351 /DNA_END=2051 /DNA_ORIENTATION=+
MFGFFEDKVNELYKVLAPEPTDEERFLSAIASGDLATVQDFIERRGYDVNWRNQNGNTPLHVACFNGQAHIVDYLIQRGADFRAKGQGNNSCLHFAAAKGHTELVKKFLAYGISILEKNDKGKNGYDVAQGFGLRQYLMPIMFEEEQRTGTAPQIVGATIDPEAHKARLANLAPPPKMGEAYSGHQNLDSQSGALDAQMQAMMAPPGVQQGNNSIPQQPPAIPQTQASTPFNPASAMSTPEPTQTQNASGPGSSMPAMPFNPSTAQNPPSPSPSTPPTPPQNPQQSHLQQPGVQHQPPSSPFQSTTSQMSSNAPPSMGSAVPPTSVHSSYTDPNRRSDSSRPFMLHDDGFVTTVGNPTLAAKYGNKSSYTDVGYEAPTSAGPAAPPTYNPAMARKSPFAQGRYVSYQAGNNTSAPVAYNSPSAGPSHSAPPSSFGGPNVQVFTPVAAMQNMSLGGSAPSPQQPQQPYQPHQPFQQQQQSAPSPQNTSSLGISRPAPFQPQAVQVPRPSSGASPTPPTANNSGNTPPSTSPGLYPPQAHVPTLENSNNNAAGHMGSPLSPSEEGTFN